MSLPAIPLQEFDKEMASTRKLLERVPTEKGRWKPHDQHSAGAPYRSGDGRRV
jgi:hypothetical protein